MRQSGSYIKASLNVPISRVVSAQLDRENVWAMKIGPIYKHRFFDQADFLPMPHQQIKKIGRQIVTWKLTFAVPKAMMLI